MGDAKIAPRPHTPENDDQGGNLVETVTSATAGGAKPAVIAARGSYSLRPKARGAHDGCVAM